MPLLFKIGVNLIEASLMASTLAILVFILDIIGCHFVDGVVCQMHEHIVEVSA